MKWLLTRVLAACAALLAVLVAGGVLLGSRYSGDPAAWAASAGNDGAWLGGAWTAGDTGADDRALLKERVAEAGIGELYVLVGDIAADGGVDPAGYSSDEAAAFLAWAGAELPDVTVLGWLRHEAEGSSLVEDRFDEDARAAVAATAGDVAAAGFDGVHLDISPVSVNDPSMADLLDSVNTEMGGDPLLSVQSLPVELLPGMRVPYFVIDRGERYWSKGYLRQVSARADIIVVPGHDSGMPLGSLYGGYMVRQVEEAVEGLRREGAEGTAVRFGVPAYDGASGAESTGTAVEAVRLGLTRAGREEGFGTAVYLLDTADAEQWRAYVDGWVAPAG